LLLETAMPRVRSFCGTVTILLGNVLALMLTLLSMSKGTDVELKWAHYQRVKQIAFIDAVTLIAAVLIYLVLNFPLADADAAQQAGYTRWYAGVYYVVLALVSLLGGALISVVLMLYNAVRDVIQALGPDRDESSFVRSEEAAQEAKRQADKAQEEAQEARNQAP
jgi:heme A synthase